MRILANPSSSSIILENCRGFCSSNEVFLRRPEVCGSRLEKPVKLKLLHFVSALRPARLSLSSKASEVDLGTAESQAPQTDKSKTVHVRFLLQKECLFGEHFFIVGNDPIFGLWEPNNAIPLNWSDGHVWSLDLDLPIGKSIEFKILLKGNSGEVLWQPGPNRVFEAWQTINTITIYEDWESAELQKVCVEELVTMNNDVPQSILNSVKPIVDTNCENTNIRSPVIDTNSETTKTDIVTLDPSATVADNISLHREDSLVNISFDAPDENKRGNSGEFPAVLDKSMTVENTVSYDEASVLLPSLISTSIEEINEVPGDNSKEEDTKASTAGSGDAKIPGSFELDEKQDTEDLTQSAPMETLINGAEQRHHQRAETEYQLPEQQLVVNEVLENDIQWGRRALQKLLDIVGFLLH